MLLAHFVAHMRVPIWSLVLPSTAQRLASISFGTVAYRFFGFLCPSGHANLLTTWWLLKASWPFRTPETTTHNAGCQIKAPCGGSASCSWFCFGGIYCTGEAAQVVSLEWADPARLDVENSYKHRWRFSTLLGLCYICYIEVMGGGWCVGSGQ